MNVTVYRGCGIFMLFVLLLMTPAQYSFAKGLTVTKTVYVERSTIIDPRVIKNSGDDGFIVAGSVQSRLSMPQKNAWAAKVEGAGKEIGRYTVPVQDKRGNAKSPLYYSAAVARDGSVFLCGEMPFDVKHAGHSSTGFITHLDKDGKKLSENLVYPLDQPSRSTTTLVDCLFSGDGV